MQWRKEGVGNVAEASKLWWTGTGIYTTSLQYGVIDQWCPQWLMCEKICNFTSLKSISLSIKVLEKVVEKTSN